MDIKNLGLVKLIDLLDSGKVSVDEIYNYYLQRIERIDPNLNSYITVIKKPKRTGELKGKLRGLPIAVKDIFSTEGIKTTAASIILENYTPTFSATVVERILSEDGNIIGKTNLDEFCHGSSTETSCYGTVKNPWDLERSPGGSSGGSAAALMADLCAASIGTETAGSIRLPSSWCGAVGLKPTYGRVSRYGVLAMGSSLDSPGPITKSVDDAAYLLSIIAGDDKNDFTTSKEPVNDYYEKLSPERVKNIRIGIPKEYIELDLEDGVREKFNESVSLLKRLGADIVDISLLDPKLAIAVYTIICRSEVSSNLSRYDGTRYGIGQEEAELLDEAYSKVRGKGFGIEAKRRIMTGTHALSTFGIETYKKASEVRDLLTRDIVNVLENVDLIISPTTPNVAPVSGSAVDNPLFGEMADVLAETSSLAGLPAISIPVGYSEGLPVGLQIIGNYFDEQTILDIAKAYEREFNG
ncbi:MAG TPA: Asp-tRNA(Asn)/Glu-tRNA(Gln) amidotransferase subunit GatA, partial [bacterium]|nr:Asp-tRNA(Asn)/Glu-tRNA(Gln) amidotransferase subunit GatA [bacterium]